jgi:ribose 5-phosphate isomerase
VGKIDNGNLIFVCHGLVLLVARTVGAELINIAGVVTNGTSAPGRPTSAARESSAVGTISSPRAP